MNPSRAIVVMSALTLGLIGCEDKSPPPASASSNSGGPLGGVIANPTSLPGRSVDTARQAVKGIEAAQDQAMNIAQQNMGGPMLVVGKVQFAIPQGWSQAQTQNSMQAAALKVSGDSEAACVFLTGIGGDVNSNVSRWRGMVTDPGTGQPADSSIITKTTTTGLKVTIVSMSGTYSSMMNGAPTPVPGQGFRGAIIETTEGNLFVRMTGPKASVDAAGSAWEAMVLGATPAQ